MRLLVTVVDPRREGPRCRDVLIEAPAGTTLADVSDDLRREVGCREEHLAFRAEGRSLEASHPLGEPPLLHGAILTLERPASSGMPLTPEAVVSLDVVGGPGAGQVVPLGRGVHVVGRSGGCAVRLADGTVSRHHLELCVTSTGVTARDLSPTNRSTLGGAPLGSEATPFEPGERLRLGSTTLVHRLVPVTPAASIVVDGFRTVHRPPRFTKASTVAEIEFP
ncbi:MAG TPA: FHA domain-containing protein, partial [Intrasporangium sp.]|nr:FHA domain-containing protein [Intrasporangium sp.]